MCMSPIEIKKYDVLVPCGKCPQCRARRASGWSFRLMEEAKHASSSLFITLTYDTREVPISRGGFMSLSARDLQLFFKRLRKLNRTEKIKYYAVGEYGGKTKRPHYHIILFNARYSEVELAWGKGSVHYGAVNGASVGYTLKYISKSRWYPMHRNDDREPEFSRMSKGLGKSYITPRMLAWHKADPENRMYLNLEGGKKCSMPRYFKDLIFTRDERSEAQAKFELEARKRLEILSCRNMLPTLHENKERLKAAYKRSHRKAALNTSL